MSNTDEWALRIGDRKRSGERAVQDQEQAVAMKREIIAENMPRLWEELAQQFRSHCEAYNKQNNPSRRLSCLPEGGDRFVVKPDALPEVVTLQFNRMTLEIMIKVPSGAEWYVPRARMTDAGSVDLVRRTTGQVVRLGDIVESSLEDAILNGRLEY